MEREYIADRDDQAKLANTVSTPGFKVVLKIWQAECEKFTIALMNTPNAETAKVIAGHNAAQMAEQFLTMIVDRINEEVQAYTLAPRPTDLPIDITEGILDIGDLDPEDSF